MNLKNRIVVITGTSRGLGHALKEELKARGAIVAGCSLQESDTKESVKADVRHAADVQAFIQDVLQKHGHIDVLINNAGWSPPVKLLETVTEAEFKQCVDVNVLGFFHMIHAVLPPMKERNEGTIITVCSRAGSRAHPGLTVYSAAKYAQRALIQGLARELTEEKSAVHCFSISPGGINTTMREELFGSEDSARQQSPEKVASLIADLLEGTPSVDHGSDVQIVRGVIERIAPMDDR